MGWGGFEGEADERNNMKILLYGIGKELENVESRIKEQHEIIGYMDSYAKINIYRGKPFFELNNIKNIIFDYLIITLSDRKVAWNIQEMLINNYDVLEEKIIPFWVYVKRELWNIKMKRYDLESIKGLIFGNSHAICGFLEEELFLPFVNLAVTSQDLYYSYRVFQNCMEKYGAGLKNLEYIVVDLYDYIEFNIDLSLTSYCLDYIYNGGIQEEHNFRKNKNFSDSMEMELFKRYGVKIKGEKIQIMEEIFGNLDAEFDYVPGNRWRHIEQDIPLPVNLIIGSGIRKRFEKTIQENVNILEEFINEIRNKNLKMKIIFTLIPKYISMEKAVEPVMYIWKKEFYQIVSNICNRYGIYFFDYKASKSISENHMFYYDAGHLNTVSARAMTAILNEDLKQL